MNALIAIEPAPTAGPHGEGHTVFSPERQAGFLASLQLFGPEPPGVRLAARVPRAIALRLLPQCRAVGAVSR